MAIPDGGHDGDGEEKGVGHGPVVVPALPLPVVVELLDGVDDGLNEGVQVSVHLRIENYLTIYCMLCTNFYRNAIMGIPKFCFIFLINYNDNF